MINQIISTVLRVESVIQLMTNKIVDAKNQLEELSTDIENLQVQVSKTEAKHKEEVKYQE